MLNAGAASISALLSFSLCFLPQCSFSIKLSHMLSRHKVEQAGSQIGAVVIIRATPPTTATWVRSWARTRAVIG